MGDRLATREIGQRIHWVMPDDRKRGKTPGGASFSAWHETPKYDSMAV
jgi:hypothetical protein